MLMADRFRIAAFAYVSIEPSARILAASFPRHRQAPLTEVLFEVRLLQRGEVSHFANAAGVKITFGDFPYARDSADFERSKKARLAARKNPQNPIGLGLVGCDLRHQPRRGRADGAVEIGRAAHRVVQLV